MCARERSQILVRRAVPALIMCPFFGVNIIPTIRFTSIYIDLHRFLSNNVELIRNRRSIAVFLGCHAAPHGFHGRPCCTMWFSLAAMLHHRFSRAAMLNHMVSQLALLTTDTPSTKSPRATQQSSLPQMQYDASANRYYPHAIKPAHTKELAVERTSVAQTQPNEMMRLRSQ